MAVKLKCVGIIFYSPDGSGMANPDLWVDHERIDPEQCTESEGTTIACSAIRDLDGYELTLEAIEHAFDHYADSNGEYEFSIAIDPEQSANEAILYVLNNPAEFSLPATSLFVGWSNRPFSSNVTLIDL